MSDLLAPETLEEALELLAEAVPPIVLAGGTDLWPLWASQGRRPERVLSLHRLEALRQIGSDEGLLRIGATCTHRQLQREDAVCEACPALCAAAATVGAVQVQNQGTIGGNIANASPAADLPPALLAAGAFVELASRRGVRRVALSTFYLAYRQTERRPDELLTAVLVPPLPPDGREHFRKVGTRRAQAISKVVAAARLVFDGEGRITAAAVGMGSIAPISRLLDSLGAWLSGRRADEETAREAACMVMEDVQPIDDVRSSASYRRYLCGRLVRGFILGEDAL